MFILGFELFDEYLGYTMIYVFFNFLFCYKNVSIFIKTEYFEVIILSKMNVIYIWI